MTNNHRHGAELSVKRIDDKLVLLCKCLCGYKFKSTGKHLKPMMDLAMKIMKMHAKNDS